MGTRNITTVKVNNRTKVIQYGQWDGYPTGQGKTIAEFLQNVNIEEFKKKVEELKKYSQKEIEDIWVEAGAPRGADMVGMDVANRVKENHPEISRDIGAEILKLISEGKVSKVVLATGQLRQSWIEFLYEVNLDKEIVRVSVNGGRSFARSIPFKDFTVEFMPKLEKELSEHKYGKEESE